MLKQLNIRDFAVIDELELLFKSGMTTFTGETGAGKSILVDALGLILGDRADTTIIRHKSERTEITAIFDIENNENILDILETQAIQLEDSELLIRRIISKDGRSRAFVNNSPVTAQLLRNIGEHLVDIHGQHNHQSLTNRDIQRLLLDEFGTPKQQLSDTLNAYNNWHEATSRLQAIHSNIENQDATLSLLRYQVQELDKLQPQADEYDNLEEEYRRLANANHLLEISQKVLATLNEDEHSIYSKLNTILVDLQELHKFDESIASITELLDSASIQLSEASDELSRYLGGLSSDPEHLQSVEKRLSELHSMARKHQIQPQQLAEHMDDLKRQLFELENSQQLISELKLQQSLTLEQYQHASLKLHQSREQAAAKMAEEITAKLKALGMANGRFSIAIDFNETQDPKALGNDQIEFLVNTNPGQSLQPLRKIASGGELSRISLAIQVIASHDKAISTLVFDEVDAGIGGGIAEIVGKLLHDLSTQHQIFCVTHLPQVASQGDHHLQVEKLQQKGITRTKVNELNAEQRIEEIARMLGGIKITDQSRDHAKEMLETSLTE